MSAAADFQTGLLDTSDIVTCIIDGYFCGACSLARQHQTLDGGGEVPPLNYITHFCCAICCNYIVRGKIREKYNLGKADLWPDFIYASYPCLMCSIAQQWREMEAHDDKPARCGLLG